MNMSLKKIVSFLFVFINYGNLWSQRIFIYDDTRDTRDSDEIGLFEGIIWLLIM